jgi:A/G-specific adenine glycosylase
VQRRQWPKAEILLQRRPPDASQMPNMWELPAIKEGQESEDMLLLTVRHSITNTNYYVTVYGLTINEQKLLAKETAERVWVPVLDLLEQPLTGLTRKILKRLRVMPGYSGGRPMVVDEQGEDAFAVFDTATVTR